MKLQSKFPNKNFVKLTDIYENPIEILDFSTSETHTIINRYLGYDGIMSYIDNFTGNFIIQNGTNYKIYEYRCKNILVECIINDSETKNEEDLDIKNAVDIRIGWIEPIINEVTNIFGTTNFNEVVYTGKVMEITSISDTIIKITDIKTANLNDKDFINHVINFGDSSSFNIIESSTNTITYSKNSSDTLPEQYSTFQILNLDTSNNNNIIPDYVYITEAENEFGYPPFTKLNQGGLSNLQYVDTENDNKSGNIEVPEGEVRFVFNENINTWIDNEFFEQIIFVKNPNNNLYNYYTIQSNTNNSINATVLQINSAFDWYIDNNLMLFDIGIIKNISSNIANDFGTELLQNLDLVDNYYEINNIEFNTKMRFIITCIYDLETNNSIDYSKIKMLINFKV